MPFPLPRAAYVHVPFCRHRCGYCNFTVAAGRDDLIEPYLAAVAQELRALETPRQVATLFLGGGTPTHLSPSQLERLLRLVREWFPLDAGGEFSVEANPGDITSERLVVLSRAGVTRISLGGQSFSPEILTRLERDHSPDRLADAIAACKQSVASVSVDLIFAVPGQSLNDWKLDVDRLISLRPDHISTYGLTFERGTRFFSRLVHGELAETEDDLWRAMYAHGIDALSAAGFEHYEISNFARPGHRCRHNQVYWAGESYWAVGPGASRYVDGRRETNHRSLSTYLKRIEAGTSPVAESETLSDEDRARELAVFALRRTEGLDRAWFLARSGFEFDTLFARPLARYQELGLLVSDGPHVRLTRDGLFVSDALWPDFLTGE
jgi:oxygen-independent coproporphyrinogen-3 oxidase